MPQKSSQSTKHHLFVPVHTLLVKRKINLYLILQKTASEHKATLQRQQLVKLTFKTRGKNSQNLLRSQYRLQRRFEKNTGAAVIAQKNIEILADFVAPPLLSGTRMPAEN